MATSAIKNVRITGIASAVPSVVSTTADLARTFGDAEAAKLAESSGVKERRIATDALCTSDLCEAAARRLLQEMSIDAQTVDALIFVSQTPDYLLPATSCVLQGRLGLSKACAAFDVSLGCSGYVYGMWIGSSLIAAGAARRVLLLVGDTISRTVSPEDRSTATLFGDAGTATLLEFDEAASPLTFVLGTDGRGAENLIVPAGGFRRPRGDNSSSRTVREGGNVRSDEDLYMNGAEVFTFTLREVPSLIQSALAAVGWTVDDVNAYVFHQANRFMLTHLAKKIKLPADRVVIALENFGNTSSASIPLAISAKLRGKLDHETMRVMMAGFGVGLSWGAMVAELSNVVLPEIVTVPVAPGGSAAPLREVASAPTT
jgi:3-oxoacyl-[acyl-carrier-protein] synthase-3